MRGEWQILSLVVVAGLSFYLGSIVTSSDAQSQERKRDAQGRFHPVPQFPFPEAKASFGVIGDIAFRVNDVSPDSPAQQLGLQKGDLIVRIDGKQFYSINDWMELLSEKNPGEEVRVEYIRFNCVTCVREHRGGQAIMAPLKR